MDAEIRSKIEESIKSMHDAFVRIKDKRDKIYASGIESNQQTSDYSFQICMIIRHTRDIANVLDAVEYFDSLDWNTSYLKF